MSDISISDALRAVETLNRFLTDLLLHRTLVQFESGGTVSSAKRTTTTKTAGGLPKTWRGRVAAIFADIGPAKPADVKEEYLRRGWPVPDKSKVASLIRSTIANMKRDGHLEVSNDGKYRAVSAPRGE